MQDCPCHQIGRAGAQPSRMMVGKLEIGAVQFTTSEIAVCARNHVFCGYVGCFAVPIGPPTYPEWELVVEPEDAYGGSGAVDDAETDR